MAGKILLAACLSLGLIFLGGGVSFSQELLLAQLKTKSRASQKKNSGKK